MICRKSISGRGNKVPKGGNDLGGLEKDIMPGFPIQCIAEEEMKGRKLDRHQST